MTQSFEYDGAALLRVRGSSVELTQTADHGAVGMGRFTVNDTAGTTEIVGTKDFSATQDDCSIDIIHRGYIEDREWRRGLEAIGPAREIDVTVQDLNPIPTFLKIGDDGDRTETETVSARLTWLLDTYLPGLGTDRVTFDTAHTVEPSDYTGQDCNDVIAALALAAGGFNHHVQDYGDGPELIFRDDNTSTADTATIFISNRYSDVDDETVFAPLRDFKLTSRPGDIGSNVRFEWADGAIFEERTQTATDFNGERDITATDSNIKSDEKARDAAKRELWTHHTEEHILEGTILVPPEAVNLAPAGFRIGIRLEHLQNLGGPGITTYFDPDEWIYCRILERTVRPMLKPTRLYEIQLKLSPQEPPEVADTCSDLYSPTPSDTYYPLGGSGSTSNPSDGVVYYFRPGIPEPIVPTPGYQGGWHFGLWGAGGLGSIDYAGDCVASWLIFLTVGNGTWTIQTETAGTGRTLYVQKGRPGFDNLVAITALSPGDSVEVTIDDTSDGDCLRWVAINDGTGACGSKWGWSEAVWVAA